MARVCGNVLFPLAIVACGVLVSWTDMRGAPSPAWTDERRRRAADFTRQRRASSTEENES